MSTPSGDQAHTAIDFDDASDAAQPHSEQLSTEELLRRLEWLVPSD